MKDQTRGWKQEQERDKGKGKGKERERRNRYIELWWYGMRPATFKGEHRGGSRLSAHVRPTIQLSRDIWTARRVSGFVFFGAFNDTLHGPPELHEPINLGVRSRARI